MHNLSKPNCQTNLRQVGDACYIWAKENDGRWPVLSDIPGEFMFDPDQVSKRGDRFIPDFLADTAILRCPQDSDAPRDGRFPGDASYVYLGPGLETEEDALAYLDAYLQAARAGEPLPVPEYDPEALDAVGRSAMPVAFDRPENHDHKYINVLYADGLLNWIEMGVRYPATKAFWDKLAEVEAAMHGNAGGLGF